MDEPFGAVDPIVRAQLQEEFLRLQRELHKTVVFVTHDVDEAITVGTQVALLRTGGVLAQIGTPREVLANPVDEFVADFMGADRQVKLLGLLPATAIRTRPLADLPERLGGGARRCRSSGRAGGRNGDGTATDVLTPVPPGAKARAVLEAALASGSGRGRARRRGRSADRGEHAGRPVADGVERMLIAEAPPYWNGPQLAGNWDVIRYYTRSTSASRSSPSALGMLLAFPIAYLCHRRPLAYPPVLAGTNMIYAIPSLALFALLGPFLGYTNDKPIIVAMALYTLVILVRNIVEGLRAVPRHVTDAATGLGYGPFRRFLAVELPLAVPTIIAGLRLATVSTISLITVGGAIGKGALGRMFADGIDRGINVELWAGVLAVIVLALAADLLILSIGRLLTPWSPGGAPLMGAIGDGFGWLFDSANWWGPRGLVQRIVRAARVLGLGARWSRSSSPSRSGC